MSVKMMSMVFDRFPLGGNERLLALALADHAHDDGTKIHPGFERLAEKVLVSERTIIRLIQKLIEIGWLIKVTNGNSVRGFANEYCINKDWISGDNLSPQLKNVGVTNEHIWVTNDVIGVTPQVSSGDTAMSHQRHQPSIQHQTTSLRARDSESEKPEISAEGLLACRLIPLGVSVSSMHPTLCRWVADEIDLNFILECVALARQNKPLPEKIPANYLDSIIRNELKPKKDFSWLLSDDATISKGNEVGIYAKVGESMSDYRTRLKDFITESLEAVA